MQNLQVVEIKGKRVLTSAQIAYCYGTTIDCIKQNFHVNKNRFVNGKHYIALEGDELRKFKNEVRNSHLVRSVVKNEVRNSHLASDKAQYQIDTQFKYAKSLYLWTEKGALLHAKSLNTDKAWEVYDYLVDFYFRVKEQSQPEKKAIVPVTAKAEPVKTEYPIPKYTVVDIPENAEAQKAIQDIKKALAAIEIMVDESNRYIGKDSFLQYRRGMTDSVHALMARITRYLDVTPKLIEKQL